VLALQPLTKVKLLFLLAGSAPTLAQNFFSFFVALFPILD